IALDADKTENTRKKALAVLSLFLVANFSNHTNIGQSPACID
ncbi:hypothetical protein L915_10748, partial [Phytophthora nicotianae]